MAVLMVYLCGCFVLISASIVNCAPLAQEKLPSKEMEAFMKQFGYIDSGPNKADSMYTEEGFKSAVQLMQRFGGLPESGELDEATLNLTKAPRCGVPDVMKNLRPKRYIIGSKAWKKKGITYFLANWPSEIDPEVTRSKLEKALSLWSEVSPLKFRPLEGMDADLIIAFGRSEHGDGYPFDGQGNILAHAFFPYEHGSYGGDIHFDDDEEWIDGSVDKKRDGVDFYTVAAHEIGHSLGLAHSTVPNSIMFPYYKGYDPNMRLDYDDVVAMYSMYVLDNDFEDETTHPSEPKVPNSDDETHDADADNDDENDDDAINEDYNDDDNDSSIDGTRKDDDINKDDNYDANKPAFDGIPEGDDNSETDGTHKEDDIHSSDEHDKSEKGGESGNGDYETVATGERDETTAVYTHIPISSTTDSDLAVTAAPTTASKIPDLCDGSIDAASLVRGELFVFKGMYMWRLREQNEILQGYPVYFHYFFMGFPWSIRRIDAVYQRPGDYYIIFFTGRFFWVFDGNRFTPDSPRHLTDLGLPSDLEKLDAAIVWGKNQKTYFFSGDKYWRFDEASKSIESGYPQRMAKWKGVPTLDAAFTWKDGQTYFFKEKEFWRFNNKNISVDAGFPLQTGPYWFDCPS